MNHSFEHYAKIDKEKAEKHAERAIVKAEQVERDIIHKQR